MSLLRHGAQWASPRSTGGSPQSDRPRRMPAPTRRAGPRSILFLVATLAALLPVSALPAASPANAADDFILMPRSELTRLPTSGAAWSELKAVADASLGTPNLCDKDDMHHLRTMAAALVFARTGSATYGTKARAGVMAAIKTQQVGCGSGTLSLGRQLLAYVLAADFAELSGSSDSTFRTWLSAIRTKNIGGHSKWWSLTETHREAAGNWGAYAGASRIAASLYLGDSTDVAAASKVTRGFLGDRGAYAGFGHVLDSADLSWSCSGSQATYTPVNPTCERGGVQLGGGVVVDISRGGARRWPPLDPGIPYQLDSIQGLGMQVELLYRHGYPDAWGWSSSALKRMGDAVSRSASAGGTGWNETTASRQMPWLLNKRYGTTYPTKINGTGRAIGFTSWLYGGAAALPSAPTVNVTDFRMSVSKNVSESRVKTIVSWELVSKGTGLKRYEFQESLDGGAWTSKGLTSPTAKMYGGDLLPNHTYAFRVRAVDTSLRAGPWVTTRTRTVERKSEASDSFTWNGSWRSAESPNYIGGKARSTDQAGATLTFSFTGNRLAWIGPIGPTRGKSRVYVDGKAIAVVDQYAKSFVAKRVVLTLSLSDNPHKVEIRALGTAGRPTVAIDAIDLLDPR